MIMLILWVLAVAIVSSIVTEVCFILCLTCKRLLDEGAWLPVELKLVVKFVLLPIGLVGDAVMSQTRGRIEFGELRSRGVLMTSRIQWHVDNSSGWRLVRALRWATLANRIDPEHIDLSKVEGRA